MIQNLLYNKLCIGSLSIWAERDRERERDRKIEREREINRQKDRERESRSRILGVYILLVDIEN